MKMFNKLADTTARHSTLVVAIAAIFVLVGITLELRSGSINWFYWLMFVGWGTTTVLIARSNDYLSAHILLAEVENNALQVTNQALRDENRRMVDTYVDMIAIQERRNQRPDDTI